MEQIPQQARTKVSGFLGIRRLWGFDRKDLLPKHSLYFHCGWKIDLRMTVASGQESVARIHATL